MDFVESRNVLLSVKIVRIKFWCCKYKEYCQLNSGQAGSVYSKERRNCHWFRRVCYCFRPICVAPLFRIYRAFMTLFNWQHSSLNCPQFFYSALLKRWIFRLACTKLKNPSNLQLSKKGPILQTPPSSRQHKNSWPLKKGEKGEEWKKGCILCSWRESFQQSTVYHKCYE